MYAKPIRNLIQSFRKLPSVGTRTAERFVFYLLKSGKKDVGELALALKELAETIRSCNICWDFSDTSPCAICSDAKRNKKIICVVGEPQDIQSVERIGIYGGVYHVLRGTVSPDDPNGTNDTKIKELFERIDKETPDEIILALNPNMEGETTMLFLEKQIKKSHPAGWSAQGLKIKITRLARGLPMGSDLEYADEITLESAFKHRISQ